MGVDFLCPKGTYMSDFIEVDYSKMNIKQLINQLDKLDKHAVNQIMPEVMQAVGNELLQEEKHILSGGQTQTGKPFKFADKLSIMNEHTGKLWRVKAGYSTEVIKSNIEVFNLLADKLNSNALKNISAVNVKIQFEIENGRVITSPFDLKVGGATLTLSGSTGLDQTIDYKTTIKLPEGSSVSEYVGSVSGNITGTFTKPVISLDMKSLAKEALKTTVSTQIEKLTGKNNEEQIAALREEADKAAEKLVEVARTEGQKLVDKASNPIAKIAAQAAAKKLEEEAQKQADALRAKAEEEIKKLEAATAE